MSDDSLKKKHGPLIVGVGASAGGLEAFQGFLASLGDSPGISVVFVQHLDPNSQSLLPDLLKSSTALDVVEIKGRKKLKANTLYVCPPQTLIELKSGFVRIAKSDQDSRRPEAATIDHFFHSIAEDQADRGIGVILSGAGSDGTLGLKAISDRGGLTFAQEAKSASHDSMPRSAATTGVADHVLDPAGIATELLRYANHLDHVGDEESRKEVRHEIIEAVPAITEALLKVTDHNFQHYKVTTLCRRIQRRMQVLHLCEASEYVSYLENHDDEAHALFRELLIGVTHFFRDPDAFASLSETVLSKIFANRTPDDSVRIWAAGCANGSEAYTLAILCRETMERLKVSPEVQIFATDIDERALSVARAGVYPVGIEEHVTPKRLKRFFVKRGKRYQVTKEIRELVLFSSHNLISDPPFSRQDLICCRNLLIYLGSHLQNKLIPLFHYGLRPSGFLFLGPSETITSHGELFRPHDTKHRISQRKGTAVGSPARPSQRRTLMPLASADEQKPDAATDLTLMRQRILLDEFSPKSCVIDGDGQVLNAAADMNKYLSVGGGDFHNNIISMAAKGLRIGLRKAINDATKTCRKVEHENMSIRVGDMTQEVMITVQPMPELGEDEPLFMVVFHDVGLPIDRSAAVAPAADIPERDEADSVIWQMELELQTTRDDLERTMQDMEATNEELKSSNEELLSMNEELQSANEELATSKEEIRTSSDAVARANSDLENLLRSTQIATVFLDDELRIRSFTPAISEIYELIPTDIGRPLERFVPMVHDMPPLPTRNSLSDGEEVEHTVVADSGRSYLRRVLPYRLHTGENAGVVVTFSDVTQLAESRELFQLLVNTSAQIVWMTDAKGMVTTDSPSWRDFTGQTLEQWLGHGWLEMIHPDDRESSMKRWMHSVESQVPLEFQYRLRHHSGQFRWTQVRAVAQCDLQGNVKRWVGMNLDIQDREVARIALQERAKLSALNTQLAVWLGGTEPLESILQQCCQQFVDELDVAFARVWLHDEATSSLHLVASAGIYEQLNGVHSSIPIGQFKIGRIAEQQQPLLTNDVANDPNISDPDWARSESMVAFAGYPLVVSGKTVGVLAMFSRHELSEAAFEHLQPMSVAIAQCVARKDFERKLADREQHLRRVINHQLGLVGVIDRDGILLEVDDDSMSIAGLTREDVIGKHFAECAWWSYDPAIAKQMRETMERAFAGEVVRYDVEFFAAGLDTPDQRLMIDFMMAPVFDAEGEVEYLIPSGVDISDRKQQEMQLRDSEKFTRTVLESSPDCVKVLDSAGRLEMMNVAGMCQMEMDDFGEFQGKEWCALWPDESQTLVSQAVNAAREQGEGRFQAMCPTAKGTPKWWDVIVTPVRDGETIQRFVSVSRDITRQRIDDRNLAFRAALLDELNGIDSTDAMRKVVTRRVAEYFDANRCYLVDIDSTTGNAEVFADYSGDLPSLVGSYSLDDLLTDDEQQEIAEDKPLRVNDICSLGRSPERIQQFEAMSVRAMAEGQFRKSKNRRQKLVVTKPEPYHWRDEQIKFLKDLAEVINISLERVRSREAIHAANAKLTDLLAENQLVSGRLAIAMQTARMGSFEWNRETGNMHWDDQWCDMAGLARDVERSSEHFYDMVHPDDLVELQENRERSYREQSDYRSEFRLLAESGGVRWLAGSGRWLDDEQGRKSRLVGLNWDITESKEIAERIKRNEERLRLALKAGKMAAWEWRPDGSFWTPELYQLIGIPEEVEASPETLFKYVHPDDIESLKNAWRKSTEGHGSYDHKFRILRSDGETRWIYGLGEVELDRAGEVSCIYGLNWDSTEEHRAAEKIRLSEQKALRANVAKSEFLANMSHEIRTPMTAILGYADLVGEQVESEEAKQHLQTIRRNGDFLLEIINDILDLSKIEAGKFDVSPEPFSPQHLVEDVRSIMSVRAKENGLILEIEYSTTIPKSITSDSKRLKQILINLVGNAIKFTKQGRVRIIVSYQPVGDEATSPFLRFDIVDTGIGITPEQQKLLFQPFSQADATVTRNFGGTGLGLAISRRLAGLLGGDITVQSEAGVGSTFSVCIEARGVNDSDLSQPSSAKNKMAEGRKPFNPADDSRIELHGHVLIVDDSRDIRFLSKRILTKAGADVTEAEDGEEAIEAVEQAMNQAKVFDMVLLDMQMPRLDGYQTAKRLRKMGFAGPIIALTADAMHGDMNRCIESGCNDYLSKPIDARLLLSVVRKLTSETA